MDNNDATGIVGTSEAAVSEGPPDSSQDGSLIVSLTRIQRGDLGALAIGNRALAANLTTPGATNVVRELRRTSLAGGLGPIDSATLDIVALLFDQVFTCEKIPPVMKQLIGRLQIPILKVAILDKSFLCRKTHPARKLLDCLGDIALSLTDDLDESSPLYDQIQKTVRELVEGFQYSLDIFDRLHQELEAFVAWQNRPAEEQAELVARRVECRERLAVAKAVAQREILQRAASASIPRTVLRFLTEQWVKVMLIAHAQNGGAGEAWNKAVATMDLLIWSVRPKHSPGDRRMLAAVLPRLIRRLNSGLRKIGIEDDERKRFFAQLMRCHVDATNAPSIGQAVADIEPGAGPLKFHALTLRNPLGDGKLEIEEISLSELPACGAAPLHAGMAGGAIAGDEYIRVARSLGPGAWVDFRGEGNSRGRARLFYVSPLRRTYLFVNRQNGTVGEYSVSQLARELRAGRASVIETTPLFDQTLDSLIGTRGASPTLH